MNFWIKLTCTFLISIFLQNILIAQEEPVITIMGKSQLMIMPIAHSIEFSFVENGVTCGPNAQFESIDEQYSYFIYEIIKNDDVAARVKLVDKIDNYYARQPTKTYSFEYTNMEEAKLMYKWAKEGFAEKIKYFSTYPKKRFEEEDQLAIEAYKNSRIEALSIAKLRGYSDVELVSIDDNTSGFTGLRRKYEVNVYPTKFDKNEGRPQAYNLRVKYMLK